MRCAGLASYQLRDAPGGAYAGESMRPGTSCYLDMLRIGAALVVFGGHCLQFWHSREIPALTHAGHRAVIIFFVLSGYVIAHAAFRKTTDFRRYALARLSRLYSVVLPGIALTALLLFTGRFLQPGFYGNLAHGHDTIRLGIAAVFAQELGPLSASPPTNAPLWSLGYEFWYYALFGAAFLIKSDKIRWLSTAAVALLAGYKACLLLPVWLLGVALYRHGRTLPIPSQVARWGWLCSIVLTAALGMFMPDYPSIPGYAPLFYSGAFCSDLAFGLLVAVSIGCFDLGWGNHAPPPSLGHCLRKTGDHTFSLYVYHYPLIVFATAVVPFDHHSSLQAAGMAFAILIIIAGLGLLTEAKREFWRRVLARCWPAQTPESPPSLPVSAHPQP